MRVIRTREQYRQNPIEELTVLSKRLCELQEAHPAHTVPFGCFKAKDSESPVPQILLFFLGILLFEATSVCLVFFLKLKKH